MNATLPAVDHTLADTSTPDSDAGTRQRVLQIVAAAGPVSAAELAAQLDLAPAGIRRHLGVLEATDQIAVHDGMSAPKVRGRPARRYVVTSRGQAALSHRYSELASQALRFLAETGGDVAVREFATRRVAFIQERFEGIRAEHPELGSGEVLAQVFTAEGYAATVRDLPRDGQSVGEQLCQQHCPVAHVAHEFPQLCEAETEAIGLVLGRHVQRLATIAHGDGVCTTCIPSTPTTTPTNTKERVS